MAYLMASLPKISGIHSGAHAMAVAIRYKEPGWFTDGSSALLIMYTDGPNKSDPLKWVDKDRFFPDHEIIER